MNPKNISLQYCTLSSNTMSTRSLPLKDQPENRCTKGVEAWTGAGKLETGGEPRQLETRLEIA